MLLCQLIPKTLQFGDVSLGAVCGAQVRVQVNVDETGVGVDVIGLQLNGTLQVAGGLREPAHLNFSQGRAVVRFSITHILAECVLVHDQRFFILAFIVIAIAAIDVFLLGDVGIRVTCHGKA